MTPKLDQLREAWGAGDKIGALRIAARFHDRSEETITFKRGWDAAQRPDFFRQIGRDPAALTEAAFEAMARKFKLS